MKTQTFKGNTLTRTKVKNNILKIWNLTDSGDRFDWYKEGHYHAIRIARLNNLIPTEQNLNKICGVMAALSPVKRWNDNIKCAEDFVSKGDCGHMRAFKDKARNIMSSNGSELDVLTILNGNKISAFFLNLRHPDKLDNVTIDRHALSVALGHWVTEDEYRNMTLSQYTFFVNCYKLASNKVSVSPLLMQSATWVKWREIKKEYKSKVN